MENSTKPDLRKEMLKNDYYAPKYDYNTEYSCEQSGCHEEGICRCGRINDAHVESVDLSYLTIEIYDQLVPSNSKSKKRDSRISQLLYGGELVDKYCIYRILSINKVWNTDLWEVNTSGGYYGDEVDNVTLDISVLSKVSTQCSKVFELSTLRDKLLYVIELEYGYILEDLKDCDFEIISIYKSYIDFKKLNQNHIKNVKMEDLDHYSNNNYDLPRGIVRGDSTGWVPMDNYKIVDGFHRIIAAHDKKPFQVFCVKK
jgi:hypothetical protein